MPVLARVVELCFSRSNSDALGSPDALMSSDGLAVGRKVRGPESIAVPGDGSDDLPSRRNRLDDSLVPGVPRGHLPPDPVL